MKHIGHLYTGLQLDDHEELHLKGKCRPVLHSRAILVCAFLSLLYTILVTHNLSLCRARVCVCVCEGGGGGSEVT